MKPAKWLKAGGVVVLSLTFVLTAWKVGRGPAAEKRRDATARGRELFTREWLPGDRRSHAGDGLGPLFNARSCAACHHLGGVGGAGPKHMNVTVVSAFLESPGVGFFGWLVGAKPKPPQQPDRSKLAEIHPALRTENSFPLHRFGTEKEFAKWRNELSGHGMLFRGLSAEDPEADALQFQDISGFRGLRDIPVSREVGASTIQLVASKRSAPAVFGVGIIDRIPDRVLEEVAASQARAAQKDSSAQEPFAFAAGSRLPVSGRVARLRGGQVGRFGWKAQTASLREFTLQACAIELGLEVPGFPQTAPPWKAGYKAPGLDLTADQCNALVDFVASLPPPVRKPPETEQHAAEIAAGQKLFDRTGCAACHRPKLGDVDGIYSDLLLHDMGPDLSDSGLYGGSIVPGEGPSDRVEPLPIIGGSDAPDKKPKFGAGPREWRTPPLWGLRDSAPFLHDGRADTISAAVAFHSGEGHDSSQQFFRLNLRERQQVELFLQSLAAPER